MKEVLSLNEISKVFKGFTAVNKLSFTLKPNHVIGFLGPNGAGKTTTLRMIAGLSKPSEGTITIFGKEAIFGDSEVRRDIGYLPEQPALYPWMTGKEYLSFIADLYSLTEPQKSVRIKELLEIVDLTSAKNRRISGYSNGMKQRLGIAQAIINKPKLVIMDEPVSALDPIGRKEVLKTIERIKETSTVLFSTHILTDVDRICDDVLILNKGKLVADSPLTKLKELYASQILLVEFSTTPKNTIKDLETQPWVVRYELNDRILKIWLKDKNIVESNKPLEYLLAKSTGIVKYELQIPDVEDLFIDLLEEKHE